ncbi:Signal transduction histidine kinase [Hathewaya proteolytica DSM 3090]|uniref:histidine kinase n=2 Tax=Hathewaya proteolytica TaxID=29365 RepID=A0A1M6MG98_9CLOT|nr:Signal transduction histidine kinase [Hathewaya proteolytica DSM 3090]
MVICGVITMSNLKNKIYAQSILTSLFVILTMGVLFIIFFYTYYISTAKLELRTKLNFACTLYSNHMPDVPYNEKLCYILEKEQNSVFYFQLLNHTGELVLDSNGINFYNNVLLTKDFTFAYKDDTYRDVVDALRGSYMPNEYMDNNNRRLLSMTAPIIRDGNTWGYLRYTTCLDKLFKNLYVIILIVVFTLIIIFVFTLLINSYLAKTIMKPLNKLTEISKNMSNGDFTERIDIDGNDELSKLGSNLNHMADKILEGNKLKNEFISSISHELRTPLTAIKGWTELFLTDTALSEEDKKEGLEIISAETNRLNSLVEDLLDYSRLEGRRIQLNLTKLKLYPILHEIKHYFKSQLDKSKLELIVNCEQDIVILGDSNRLKQVFINIIHNSIKFSSPYHKIFIYVITFNNYVVIKIKDQGVGISPTDIKKVKEKFYKGASSKSGSGIGLAICDEIVKLHNGTLTISSIEYEGTTVTISLPWFENSNSVL